MDQTKYFKELQIEYKEFTQTTHVLYHTIGDILK